MKTIIIVLTLLGATIGCINAAATPASTGPEVCETGGSTDPGIWIACTVNHGAILVEIGDNNSASCIGDYGQAIIVQSGNNNNATC